MRGVFFMSEVPLYASAGAIDSSGLNFMGVREWSTYDKWTALSGPLSVCNKFRSHVPVWQRFSHLCGYQVTSQGKKVAA